MKKRREKARKTNERSSLHSIDDVVLAEALAVELAKVLSAVSRHSQQSEAKVADVERKSKWGRRSKRETHQLSVH